MYVQEVTLALSLPGNLCMYVCMCVYVRLFVCTRSDPQPVAARKCMYVYTCLYMCVCLYVFSHVYVFIYIPGSRLQAVAARLILCVCMYIQSRYEVTCICTKL
jgi:hypothetical protein